jgi:phage-related protein
MTPEEIQEKNKLNATSVWIKLLEVVIPDGDTLYLCDTNDNIVWNGNTYLPFPFTLPELHESSDGSVKEVSMTLSNVRRVIGNYIQDYDYYRKNGGTENVIITLKLVNTAALDNLSPMSWTFKVLSFTLSANDVTLNVGADNLVNRLFPYYRLSRSCNWKYKDSNTCQYAGALTTCNKSLADCVLHNNTTNFGGFLALSPTGVRF